MTPDYAELPGYADASIGQTGHRLRAFLLKARLPLGLFLALATVYLFFNDKPGASAFALLSAGSFSCLCLWISSGSGLPILPLLAVQHLIIYGLPILTGHKDIVTLHPGMLESAGWELAALMGGLALAWYLGNNFFQPGRPVSHIFQTSEDKGTAMKRLSLGLVAASALYEVMGAAGLTDQLAAQLPSGSMQLLYSLSVAAGMCGYFIAAINLGSGKLSAGERLFFWLCLLAQCIISASGLLLSGMGSLLIAVAIGLFWSRGRLPLGYLACTLSLLSFFNLGKHEMRERHWEIGAEESFDHSISRLPDIYVEWSELSWDQLTKTKPRTVQEEKNRQTLAERINNLGNLLFVMDAVEARHIRTLDGASYSLIPALLVPRILWPEKPRAHAGQVLLNTHFGRQDLESTYKTYIAWGLLPEAYANFGSLMGPALLGAVLGLFSSWIELKTHRKALFSMEGFLLLSLFLNLTLSYEMVASVFITSLFQSLMTVFVAAAAFVRRDPGLEAPQPTDA